MIPEIEKLEKSKLLDDNYQIPYKVMFFGEKVLSGFPTSERGFSKHKFIHSKFRASLENTLVRKMLFIRENLMHSKEAEELDENSEIQNFSDTEEP